MTVCERRQIHSAEAYLIESANGRDEDDRVGIIKIWNPRMALPSRTAHVIQVPRHAFAVNVDIKNMFCNTHSLNSRMQNII